MYYFTLQESLYYTSQDLYVGAIITLNKHTFLLTSADEYVFSYMERPEEREKVLFHYQSLFSGKLHVT
jgi:hypothetical protein